MKTVISLNLKSILICFAYISINYSGLNGQSYLQIGGTSSPFVNSLGSLYLPSGNITVNTGNLSLTSGILSLTNGKMGIGITAPAARLHIKTTNGFPAQPLFISEVDDTYGTEISSIKHFYSDGTKNYTIYQTSSGNMFNFFQDPVIIKNMAIAGDGDNGESFVTSSSINTIKFTMRPSVNNDPVDPLTITTDGIRVRSSIVTDHLQLLASPGDNYILASDASGNASWMNPAQYINDFWKSNNPKAIYTDYQRVGIGTGTQSLTHSLQINQSDDAGGILINQTMANNFFKSEVEFHLNNNEEWAIGCDRDGNDPIPTNKRPYFYIWSNNIQNNQSPITFFIDGRVGMTGIGTAWPQAKLDVEGDFRVRDRVGIGCVAPVDNLYKLFVEGGIEARDIKVTINTFPDYVFSDYYKLLSLDDLAKFVNFNKHLPNFPSSNDVKKNNGIELGEMQVKLVEKIEELTLYILDLQKQLVDLKKEIETLKKK